MLTSSPQLRIRLFGSCQLLHDGEPVPGVDTPRQQSLLAYLLLHRDAPQARRQIAFHHWPDSTEAQALGNLRGQLHTLRQRLPNADRFLEVARQTVWWRGEASTALDVADFEAALATAKNTDETAAARGALRAAVDLYRGPLLPSCYDDWIAPARERLARAYLHALEQLAHLLEDERDYAAAIDYTQRLLDHDPLHEAGYRRLMHLHALSGDRASALRAYHTCSRVLERELGVSPDQETEALYLRLLRTDAQEEQQRQLAVRRPTQTRLVGRQHEWSQLRDLWQQAAAGRSRFVLIRGEAGIGKSLLVEEFQRWVRNQGVGAVAFAQSYALQQNLAYAPVIEWLHSPPLQAAIDQLDDVWLIELARLLPELLVARPELPRPLPMTDNWQRQRLFETLTRLICAVPAPLLLVLDDLHWCDGETLAWLHYLLVSCQESPLLLLATLRSGELTPAHPAAAILREFENGGQLTEFRLVRLDAAETAQLVEQVTGRPLAPEIVDRIYAASEGNPLFASEMTRVDLGSGRQIGGRGAFNDARRDFGLPTSLPPRIQAVIEARLSTLSGSARKVITLAAAVGRSFTFDVLAAAGHSEDTLIEALDELWRRRLIREQSAGGYDFSHDKIREVVYAGVSPLRRRLLHRGVAHALTDAHSDDLDAIAGQLAHHCERADLKEDAVRWYRRAAAVAATYALDEASLHLRTALTILAQLPDSAEKVAQEIGIVMSLSQVRTMAVGFADPENRVLASRMVDLARNIGDTRNLVLALMACSRGDYAVGRMESARAFAYEALAHAVGSGDPILHANALATVGNFSIRVGEFAEAREALREAAKIMPSLSFSAGGSSAGTGMSPWHAPANLGIVLWVMGYPDQAMALARRAEEIARDLMPPFAATTQEFLVSNVFRNLGETGLVAEHAEQMLHLGAKFGIPVSLLDGTVHKGWGLALRGDLAAGIDQVRRGVDGFRQKGHTMFQTHRLAMLTEMHLWAGQFDQAAAVLDEAFVISAEAGERFWDVELHRLHGDLLIATGAPDTDAESAYRRAIVVAGQQQAKSLELRAVMGLCRLWQRQGRRREAHVLLVETYAWFTEGFDTADLRAARALLDELLDP